MPMSRLHLLHFALVLEFSDIIDDIVLHDISLMLFSAMGVYIAI